MAVSLFVNEETVLSFASFVTNITGVSSVKVMNFKVLFHVPNIYCDFIADKALDAFDTRELGSVLHHVLVTVKLARIQNKVIQ